MQYLASVVEGLCRIGCSFYLETSLSLANKHRLPGRTAHTVASVKDHRILEADVIRP
jgi:hypothetical protein